MANDFYKIIDFPASNTGNGALTMYEHGPGEKDLIPFEIKKVLTMRGMSGKDVRGAHTHHKTNQILIPLQGACTVTLDNGSEKTEVRMDNPNKGIILYPYVWHTMKDFEDNTILMVFADMIYDEVDYIRNYDDFLGFIKEQNK